MEIAQLAAKRRSPELDVGASGATLGAHGGSTAQTWSGRSWATHAVSSVTTETRPGSVPAHRPGETPATSASSLLLHKVPPGAAAVARQTIPDDQQFAGNVAQPMREKLDDLRAANRSRKQPEVEVPPGHARDRRPHLPVEGIWQHGCLSSWCPGTAAVRALAQSTFVDEDDRPAFVFGLFFNSGQRFGFQIRIFSSSRSSARPLGR